MNIRMTTTTNANGKFTHVQANAAAGSDASLHE